MIDLLVAGGGPAGLATALHASRAGLSVRVLEPRAAVIDKACGEGLMPGALAALTRIGVDPSGHPITGIAYCAATRRVETGFGSGAGRGVRRTVLHAALRSAVDAAGVEVERTTVREVTQDDDGVTVDGVRARHLVAADGLHSPLRRSLGLDVAHRGRARYGLRRHYAVAPWTDRVEVHWGRDAEAYVTPVAPDLVGVAVLSSTRRTYDEHLAAFPHLRERVDGAGHASDVRGAGPLRRSARRRTAGRVLLVGDAAGYVDALTGEGIALGLGQAQTAIACLAAGRPDDYEALARRIGRRHELLTHLLLRATSHTAVRRRLVPAATRLPRIFTAAVNQLARPVGGTA